MQILCDVWEGSLDIDEPVLREGGVVGFMVRLNDMNGGHHMDMTFDAQWKQVENFLRAPYFVYNPWVNGAANFNWMHNHLPDGVSIVFADVEVTKPGYSPETYADELQFFYNLCAQHYKTVIYTGAWFLPLVSHWPDCEYWWARYPYYLCPQGDRVQWTWSEFSQRAHAYGYKPDPNDYCPGVEKVWQCSGDKVILPGTANRPMDLNLFNGSLAELEEWWGATLPPIPVNRLDILWREAALHGWNLEA
jgi:hypothetical protein